MQTVRLPRILVDTRYFSATPRDPEVPHILRLEKQLKKKYGRFNSDVYVSRCANSELTTKGGRQSFSY